MPDSYINLLYHIIFSTKDRRPFLTDLYQARLYDYIGGTIRGLAGISLELNGTEDHVHLLTKLRPDIALSDVLRDLKANASGWMHDVFRSSGIFPGSAVTVRLRLVNRMFRTSVDTLQDRKSTIKRFRFAMSSLSF